LNIPFEVLTRIVGLKKGTLASRYSQLYLAFIASALLHHYPLLRSGAENHSTLAYFLMQPIAITVEDLAIYLGRKAGITPSCKNSHAPNHFGLLSSYIVCHSAKTIFHRENKSDRKNVDIRMVFFQS